MGVHITQVHMSAKPSMQEELYAPQWHIKFSLRFSNTVEVQVSRRMVLALLGEYCWFFHLNANLKRCQLPEKTQAPLNAHCKSGGIGAKCSFADVLASDVLSKLLK